MGRLLGDHDPEYLNCNTFRPLALWAAEVEARRAAGADVFSSGELQSPDSLLRLSRQDSGRTWSYSGLLDDLAEAQTRLDEIVDESPAFARDVLANLASEGFAAPTERQAQLEAAVERAAAKEAAEAAWQAQEDAEYAAFCAEWEARR